jgi:hydroxymethylglutaryl-CoA lyase
MANSSAILKHILEAAPASVAPVTYQWLLPNVKGLENYYYTIDTTSSNADTELDRPRHEASIFMAATEAFSQRNTNCSIGESLSRFKPLLELAKARNTPLRAYISVALGCPYEGADVEPHKVADIALELLELGAYEISVADTTGMGTVPRTRKLLQTLAAAGVRNEDLAFHFHDTYGQALVNTVVALEHGIRTFDSAVGGLGGCPYSPGATGNVATEDLVHCLHSLGMKTGVDLPAMAEIGAWISTQLGKSNESRAGKATLAGIANEFQKSAV